MKTKTRSVTVTMSLFNAKFISLNAGKQKSENKKH